MVNNVKSKGALCKIRIKKCAVGATLGIIGALDETGSHESRSQKPDLSDLKNKWQLSQKR